MLRKNNGEAGFIVILFIVCVMAIVAMSNAWYEKETVLQELQAEHSKITKIIKTKRNILLKSVIVVRENGKIFGYLLDSSLLRNYEFSPFFYLEEKDGITCEYLYILESEIFQKGRCEENENFKLLL